MNKTLAFTGLDIHLIKPYTKGILGLLALGMVMGYALKSASILSSFFAMAFMLVLSYPFAVGEKNSLDTLYGTLSLSRKNVVVGRYVFVILLEVIFGAMMLLCSWVMSFLLGAEFIPSGEIFSLSLLSGVSSLVIAVQYPIYFKLGYNKAKPIALIPLFLVFLAILQLPSLAKLLNWDFSWETIVRSMIISPYLMNLVIPGLGLILLALSCALSCRIYTRRDM